MSTEPAIWLPDLPARYTDVEALAEGGMARIYRAFDTQRDAHVALKLMVTPDWLDPEEAAFAFRQEFWTLSSLRHPGLVEAHDFGYTPEGIPYFTMELVDGWDVSNWIPQGEDAVHAWLPDVIGALGYLHARGFVHGDVSPRNVRCKHAGGAKLMDLGLLSPNGRTGGTFAGTMDYVAPECIMQGMVDGRADLYGLGCVIFHALVGRPPFDGETDAQIFTAHLQEPPTAIADLVLDVTPALSGTVLALMAKAPDERPVDAAALARRLGLAHDGLMGRGLLVPPVIGREDVRGEIAQAIDAAGALAWLAGPAGIGKSRLLDDARATAQIQGRSTVLLRGGGGGAPYESVRPWLLGLAGLRTPGAAGMPDDPVRDRLAPYLASILPELGVAPAAPLDGQQERLRLHDAIAQWVESRMPEALWLVDDADKLDGGSRDLLGFLRARDTGCGWSWLMAARTPPEAAAAQTLWLEPLDEFAVEALAGSLLGQPDLPAEVAARLPEATAGLPAATEAALTHWLAAGELVAHEGRWAVVPGALLEAPAEPSLVYAGGFRALDAAARRLGAIAVILGDGTPIRCLAAVAGLDDMAFFRALADLERLDVLGAVDRQLVLRRCRPAEAEAAHFDEAERKKLHGDAARWLAAEAGLGQGVAGARRGTGTLRAPGSGMLGGAAPVSGADAPTSLGLTLRIARHHLDGDEPAAASPWLFTGTRLAIRLHVPEAAETLLSQALELAELPDRDRRGLQALMGELLRLRGQAGPALELLEGEVLPAMAAAHDPRLPATLTTVGVLHQIACRYDQALVALGEALAAAERLGDRSTRVRAMMATARVSYFAGDARKAAEAIAQAEQAAYDLGLGPDGLPRAVPELGTILAFRGYLVGAADPDRLDEGLALIAAGAEADRAIGNSYGLFEAATNRGNLCLSGGRVAEAVEAFQLGLDMCRRLGFTLERCFAHLNLGAARLEAGDVPGALEHAEEALDWARRQKRRFPEGFSLALEGVCRTYLGEVPEGAVVLAEGVEVPRAIENKYLGLHVAAYAAEAHVQAGRLAQALTTIEEAQTQATATGVAELDDRLARWRLAAAVGLNAPDAGEQIEARLAALAARPAAGSERAHALRWRAEARLVAGDPAGALADVHEALALAQQRGLGLLAVELAWLAAWAAQDPAALADAKLVAAEAGHRLVEAACDAGAVALGMREVDDVREELGRLMASWDDDDVQAFVASPGRSAIRALL